MTTQTEESPAIQPGRRWTIGRITTDLAIITVAVPFVLDSIAPQPKGHCGMTPEFTAFSLGLAILAIRPTWLILKALNDAGERWLDGLTESKSGRKPKPLDDF